MDKPQTETDYFYQDGTVLYTKDADGNRSSMNLLGISANVIATSRGTGNSESWYLYNKDIRESTTSIIGANGTAAATYEYDDFGNTMVTSGRNFDNEICYTGQIYDRSSGLYYYNARYYDPENARFLTQDTYRGEAEQPDTLHLYAYCKNNPINYVDPSGHEVISITLLGAAFVVAMGGCYYTTTRRFQNSWQNAANKITAIYRNVAKGVKSDWRALCKSIANSFARVKRKPTYRKKTEIHHIIAQTDRRAFVARNYYRLVGRDIQGYRNKIELKTGLHRRLHTSLYYKIVTNRVRAAYNKTKRWKRSKVDAAVGNLKSALSALNKAVPF